MSVSVLFLTIVASNPASETTDGAVAGLASRLATLRGEVEQLAEDLDERKEEHRSRMRSLAEQRADLEVQLRRENLRLDQVRAASARQQEAMRDERGLQKRLRPLFFAAVRELRGAVAVSLPFRQGDRLTALDELEQRVEAGLVRPQDGIYRLWQAIEDELRLTRESGLYRQTIQLEGREMLVDVARVGMMALYFRTQDGRFGYAVTTSDGPQYRLVNDRSAQKQLRELFDAFKKQIRVGLFTLPNTLEQGGTP